MDLNPSFFLPSPSHKPMTIYLGSCFIMLLLSDPRVFKDVKKVEEVFKCNYFLVFILATENIGNSCFPANKAETL